MAMTMYKTLLTKLAPSLLPQSTNFSSHMSYVACRIPHRPLTKMLHHRPSLLVTAWSSCFLCRCSQLPGQ